MTADIYKYKVFWGGGVLGAEEYKVIHVHNHIITTYRRCRRIYKRA
jgi:hypothetical protein